MSVAASIVPRTGPAVTGPIKATLAALFWPAAGMLLAIMVLLPMGWLVLISFQSDTADHFTLANYFDAFVLRTNLIAIFNSLLLSVGVATGATIIGTTLAWLITRTDLPLRGMVRALVLASFVTPSFVGAIAWILLASPNAGWLNQMWRAVFGGPPLVNIFSLGGAMFVMAIYAISYPFGMVASTLEQAPSEYENAARTLGAGLARIVWSVTLPLAAPAIISGFILAFLEALASFGVPAFILIPARHPVITIQLYSMFAEFPPRIGQAAAYGMPLLLVTALLLVIQRRLLARRSFTLITGKGGTFNRVALGAMRWPVFALVMLTPLLTVLLPYGAMLLVSLCEAWGRGPFAPANLTFMWYYRTFFDTVSARNSIGHSLVYCFAAATIAVTIATLVAYIRARRIIAGSAVLGFLAMAPFIVPGIVLAIGLYAAYSHPPLKLVGTPWIMILAFSTQFLPIAYAGGMSMFGTLNVDLENAGRILGATRIAVLRLITAPLLRGALLSSWMLVFITSFRELSTAIFLFVGSTAVITTIIYDFSSSGYYESVCVLSITMMIVVFVATLLVYGTFGARPKRLQPVEISE